MLQTGLVAGAKDPFTERIRYLTDRFSILRGHSVVGTLTQRHTDVTAEAAAAALGVSVDHSVSVGWPNACVGSTSNCGPPGAWVSQCLWPTGWVGGSAAASDPRRSYGAQRCASARCPAHRVQYDLGLPGLPGGVPGRRARGMPPVRPTQTIW